MPEIKALMCEAFKIQHTARICSVAATFVVQSSQLATERQQNG